MTDSAIPHPAGSVAAVIVAYFPGPDLTALIADLRPQVQRLFVIDNSGPDRIDGIPGPPAGLVVHNPRNVGIAAALNQGLHLARAAGCRWLLTLDQDVSAGPDLVARLVQTAENHPQAERLAMVAANLGDAELGIRARFLRRRFGPLFERASCRGDRLDDVALAVSAGSLYRVDVMEKLGGFREDYFIDYVDTEYCLRALEAGYRIAVACHARLNHRLGDRRRARLAGLDFFPTHHPPVRWYYIARNRVPTVRAYARRFPFWFTYDLAASAYGLMRMLLFEGDRRRKLQAVWLGTRDGLRGRMGEAPPDPALAEARPR